MGLTAKLGGYRRRAVYEWNQVRHRAAARKREAAFQSWLNALSSKPPDVRVGANFADYGGVRHHIQALVESLWPECLAARRDAQAMAHRMLALLRNAELSATIGTHNRQRIEQHFSIEGMCSFFLALWDRFEEPQDN